MKQKRTRAGVIVEIAGNGEERKRAYQKKKNNQGVGEDRERQSQLSTRVLWFRLGTEIQTEVRSERQRRRDREEEKETNREREEESKDFGFFFNHRERGRGGEPPLDTCL